MENVIYENGKYVVEELVSRSTRKEAKTFKLSPQTISCIDELSKYYNVNKTEVVEKAIQALHVMICIASNEHEYKMYCKLILENLLHIHTPD